MLNCFWDAVVASSGLALPFDCCRANLDVALSILGGAELVFVSAMVFWVVEGKVLVVFYYTCQGDVLLFFGTNRQIKRRVLGMPQGIATVGK